MIPSSSSFFVQVSEYGNADEVDSVPGMRQIIDPRWGNCDRT